MGVIPQVAQAAQPARTSGRSRGGAVGGGVQSSRGRPGRTQHSLIVMSTREGERSHARAHKEDGEEGNTVVAARVKCVL